MENNVSYTNQIIEKIKAAGIEVVTDKDEFDRILGTENSIQRMTSDIEKLKKLQKTLDDKKLQEKEIGLAEQAQEQTEKQLQEKYFEKFVNTAKEYQEYIPVGQLEKFNWVYYDSQSIQLISDSKMRTKNSAGDIAMMNICLFKDISGDLHLGVYENRNFIESISSIYNLSKEKISIPAGCTGQVSDRGFTDLNIYLNTFKIFALENDIANTFPAKIISRYETEIKSLETKNAVRINSLEKSQDNYNSYENRLSGISSENNVFSYKGYTFLPVRYFKPGNEYETVKENLTWEDAIVRMPHTGTDFSINDFFTAADKNGNADIFYCVEKGKFFTLSEAGIHSLNDGKRNKELYDSELEEFRVNNAELLSRLNKFEFNEEKDTLLMSNIAEVLELGEVFEKENETLGNVRIRKGTGINANGILHIAERRLEDKILHEHMDVQKAIEETSAILFCAINNIDKKPAVKETNGRWAVYENGIKTVINKDKNGYYVVTGFDLDETNQEATETINAVNARYGYKPEFHEIYAQVGAAYASLMERLTQQHPDVNEHFSSTIQRMVSSENTYGFVHNSKIYLNPDIMNSNAAVHEYTHLWDAYTQKTNPELWNKGLKMFKDTKYWNEVIDDPNYQDIKYDENLVLSEIHARISGDIAEKVLNRIAKLDGEQVKLDAIDWNKETWNYICEKMLSNNITDNYSINYSNGLTSADLTEFLSTPMKDLIVEKNINIPISFNYDEFGKEDFGRFVKGYNTSLAVGRDGVGEYYGRLKSGKVHTDIHIRDNGISLEHYYPKDGADYGEYEGDNGKFDYECYPGFLLREEALKEIDISNCSYDEFISFISKECIDSMKDNEEVFEAAKGPLVDWEDIVNEKVQKEKLSNIKYAELKDKCLDVNQKTALPPLHKKHTRRCRKYEEPYMGR